MILPKMSKRPKSYYQDPNRRSNWMKNEVVPARKLGQKRLERYNLLVEQGASSYESMVRALEIVPK